MRGIQCWGVAAILCIAGVGFLQAEPADEPTYISLRGLSTTSAVPGETFEMYGTWGSQSNKWPSINRGNSTKLEVISWTAAMLTVRIPDGLPAGDYKVGVYWKKPGSGNTFHSSGWEDFTVLPAAQATTPPPPHERPAVSRVPEPFRGFVLKLGGFILMFSIIGAATRSQHRRARKDRDPFPYATHDRAPFVGLVGSANTLRIGVTNRKVVCRVSPVTRFLLVIGIGLFGPGLTALLYLQPEHMEEWPTFIEFAVAFLAAMAWISSAHLITFQPRFEIDRKHDELLFFIRPAGRPIYRLPKECITRVARHEATFTSSGGSSGAQRTYPYELIAVTLRDGEEIFVCASTRSDVIDKLMEHFRPLVPTQPAAAPPRTSERGPEPAKIRLRPSSAHPPTAEEPFPQWEGLWGEEPYSVECLGYDGDDPLITVSIPLDTLLPDPLEVNLRDGPANLSADPRGGLVRELHELGCNYVDVSYNTTRVAAEVPLSRAAVDRDRAEKIVDRLVQLREASSEGEG